jgi:hypothetical protein
MPVGNEIEERPSTSTADKANAVKKLLRLICVWVKPIVLFACEESLSLPACPRVPLCEHFVNAQSGMIS